MEDVQQMYLSQLQQLQRPSSTRAAPEEMRRMQRALLLRGGMPVVRFAEPQSAMRGSLRGQKMSEFNCRHRRCVEFFFLYV